MPEIVQRLPENPLLTHVVISPSMPAVKVECLLNPGVFRFDGKIWLLVRVAERPEQKPGKIALPIIGPQGKVEILAFDLRDPQLDRSDPRVIHYAGQDYLTTLSHLRLVASEDGIHFAEQRGYPPLWGEGELESYGIEDCRVTQSGSTYYLTFTAVSPSGVGIGLRSTSDWRRFTSHGMILPPHNKDGALLEEQIDGKYYLLHRPSSLFIGGSYLWIAESPDLRHWGNHRCVARTRAGMWDSARLGAGAAPIRTPQGWLEIYHGATAENRYCLGALLLDLHHPWKVLARSREPIMEPAADYERGGFFGNVIFTNGHLVDGDQLTMYYGASDSVICGARLSIEELLRTLV